MPAKSPDEPTSHADAGDGVVLPAVEASQGAKSPAASRILWLLIASLVLVFVLLFGLYAMHAPGLATSRSGSQHSKDVSTFAAPQPSPRPGPPPTTESNGGESSANPSNVQ